MTLPERESPAVQGGAGNIETGAIETSLQSNRRSGLDKQYPYHPGAKGQDGTSQDAAVAMARSVKALRYLALETLHRLGEATVLEAVEGAGVARESLQPRFSELRAMGFVEATGARRSNPSGKSAAVLRLTVKGKAAL